MVFFQHKRNNFNFQANQKVRFCQISNHKKIQALPVQTFTSALSWGQSTC